MAVPCAALAASTAIVAFAAGAWGVPWAPGLRAGAPVGVPADDDRAALAADAHAILTERCVRCHGGVRERGGLNLLRRERAVAPGADGTVAIAPGDPGRSELLARIASHDPERRMPSEGAALTDDDVRRLRDDLQR